MFCAGCGKEVSDGDAFCRHCGRLLSTGDASVVESGQKAGPTPPAAIAPEPPRRSGEATASLILGLFSFVPVIGLIAVISGHLARASIRRSGGRLLGDGMAGVGLLLGYHGLGGWAIYGLSIIVHPLLPSTQRAENRKMAVLNLESINTANITYAATYDHGYAPSLAALGPPKDLSSHASSSEIEKAESPRAAGLIDSVLASGTETVWGYAFTYSPGKKDRDGAIQTYTVRAEPLTPDEKVHYFTDESGVIRQEYGKQATADSLPIDTSSMEH